MKLLKSTTNNTTSAIEPSKRNCFLFVFLLIIGLTSGYIGVTIGNLLGLICILYGVSCVIASFMQFIGTSECICPDCNEKGYVYKNTKKYKCKRCKTTSIVIEEDKQI